MNGQNVKRALDMLADWQDNGLVDRHALGRIAVEFGWNAEPAGDVADVYGLPNGVAVTLHWTVDVLQYVKRGTAVTAIIVEGDMYSAPEMAQLAAMFLSDTE